MPLLQQQFRQVDKRKNPQHAVLGIFRILGAWK